MNFNEKLIELRKQKGLSQEELGYQLNVTRQTVSKWELGQTTPEMDKLLEISRIFNVTVDELTNGKETVNKEVEKIEDKPINESGKNNSTVKVIILIIAIFIIGVILVYGLIFRGIFNFGKKSLGVFDKATNNQKELVGEFLNGVSDLAKEEIKNQKELDNNFNEAFNNVKQQIEGQMNSDHEQNFKKQTLTNSLELYNGTNFGSIVKSVIDKIVTNNKKYKDNIVTVIFEGKSITEPTELQELKSKFEDFTKYEISYEYDENNYIYQMDIK